MRQRLSFVEAQDTTFDTLVQLRDICADEGLRFSLAYGTLIGAVRDRDLIPWDDDIDIMMPRDDYDELKERFLRNGNRIGNLTWVDRETTERYPHAIARVSDVRYEVVFHNEVQYELGSFVDIYPFDNVGNDVVAATRLLSKTRKLSSLCFLAGRRRFAKDNTRSLTRMLIKAPAFLFAKAMGVSFFLDRIEGLSGSLASPEGRLIACTVWPSGDDVSLANKIFSHTLFDTTHCRIRGESLPITRMYHEFLTKTYGTYMERPPVGERTTNHVYEMYLK